MNKEEIKNIDLERIALIQQETLLKLEELLYAYIREKNKLKLEIKMGRCRNCEYRPRRKHSFQCIECTEIDCLRAIAYAVKELEFGSSPALPWCRESFPKLDRAMKEYEIKIGFSTMDLSGIEFQ